MKRSTALLAIGEARTLDADLLATIEGGADEGSPTPLTPQEAAARELKKTLMDLARPD